MFSFSIVFIFISCLNYGINAQMCAKLSPCKCAFPNMTGFDLSSLDTAVIDVVPSSPDTKYYYHPCPTEVETHCPENFAFCKLHNGNFTILGTVQNVAFGENATDGTSYVQYMFTFPNNSVITTIMTLQCNDISNSNIIDEDHVVPGRLILRSKAACLTPISGNDPPVVPEDEGMSSGSVLVIMFLVFGSLYFLGGMAILKFIRGASGVEIIPHYEFWSDLPFLVKDGIMFTLSGCQSAASYDRI